MPSSSTLPTYPLGLHLQGKLDADQRAVLISRGQELKDELASVEERLSGVGRRLGRGGSANGAGRLRQRRPRWWCLDDVA